MKFTVMLIATDALRRILKRLVKRLEDLGQVETIPDNSIIKISQNTEKSPRELRRLTVLQTVVENYLLTQV